MNESDVVVARSSPPGAAALGLVRGSGARVLETLAAGLLDPAPDRTIAPGIRRGRLAIGGATRSSTLPVLVIVHRGPRSYTGEDVVEIVAAGNPALLERIVDAWCDAGAAAGVPTRRAEAGEFTARAFLAGRIDLADAERVAATIAARSEAELEAAAGLARDAPGRVARRLADRTAQLLALVEAGIDFTDEEDVVAIAPAALHEGLAAILVELDARRTRSRGASVADALPRVVLAGPPNAGKSTLFNALLGRDRAVASPTQGTTRDVLEELLLLAAPGGAIEIMLVDGPGIVRGGDGLDRAAQRQGRAARREADLRIDCRAIDEPARRAAPGSVPVIRVATKSDLLHAASSGPASSGLRAPGLDPPGAGADRPASSPVASPRHASDELVLSARTGAGIDALRDAILDRLRTGTGRRAAERATLLPRQERALGQAEASIRAAIEVVAGDRDAPALAAPEIVAAELRAALDALGAVAGAISPDEVLGLIFSSFCVGK